MRLGVWLVAGAMAVGLAMSAGLMLPAAAQATSCPVGYSLVANGDLPFDAPPYGADLNRNGYQCQAFDGQVMLLTDDVSEDVAIDQCGSAFSPVRYESADVVMTAKDRNADGIVCVRVLEIVQAHYLEIFIIRDN